MGDLRSSARRFRTAQALLRSAGARGGLVADIQATAVVLGAGRGTRFGGREEGNKVFALLGGAPVLLRALAAFARVPQVVEVVVVGQRGHAARLRELTAGLSLPVRVVTGGPRRQDSAWAGVAAASQELVLVHDAARPLVSPALIRRVLAAAGEHGAAVPILLVPDTVRYVDGRGFLRAGEVDRDGLVQVQTPQGFRRRLLLAGYEEAQQRGLSLPDDAAAVLALGQPVAAVRGEPWNLKITRREDLAWARRFMAAQPAARGAGEAGGEQSPPRSTQRPESAPPAGPPPT
ncbi:MAG: 2-C-methyl-D-erythritol 4-phosphate cytidylyltransferase [Candidatus Bipolaricaulaceae bacterium]